MNHYADALDKKVISRNFALTQAADKQMGLNFRTKGQLWEIKRPTLLATLSSNLGRGIQLFNFHLWLTSSFVAHKP